MQNLIGSPRTAYTAAQITSLIQAPDFSIVPGLDQLDNFDNFVTDLTPYVEADGGTVSRDCLATIHGTYEVNLSLELQWGFDRIRPYVLCGSASLGLSNVRFNLGIYLATTPTTDLGEYDAVTGERMNPFDVTGYDKLYFLSQPVGDTVLLGQGSAVLLQVTNLILAATSNDMKINLDSTANTALLASDIVYPLTDSSPATYLDVINDLLASVNYIPLWVDQDGYFTSGPYNDPGTLGSEWTDSVQDSVHNLVADPREVNRDTFSVPNWWRFLQNGLSTAPTEGNGQFTYTDTTTPNTGYQARGYYVRKIVSVDAVNQQTLQAIAAQQIQIDTSVPEVWSLQSGTLPQSWHLDIVSYNDNDIDGGITNRKCQTTNWEMPLDGSDMSRTMTTVLVVPTS